MPVAQGLASFYTEGTRTASGERFNTHELTAAHPTLPFGTRVRVHNLENGRDVVVTIVDRGPYAQGRIIDVSTVAADALDMRQTGVVRVRLELIP